MLVVGRVELAGGQQHHRRLAGGGARRHRAQGGEQVVRIIVDRRDPHAIEQLGEQPHHRLAVLQHVGDAGGRAGIVLEHVEGVGIDPHDVDAGDVDIDIARRLDPRHDRLEGGVLQHQRFRHHAGAHDLAAMIDVADERVERLHPLLEALCQPLPFARGEHARDDIERDQPLLALGVAVDVEGDADPAKEVLGFELAALEQLGRRLLEPSRQLDVAGSDSR